METPIPSPPPIPSQQETGGHSISTDNFEAVAASIPGVIGDPGGAAAPGPGTAAAPSELDTKIAKLSTVVSPEKVEQYLLIVFKAAASAFHDDGLMPEPWEKEMLVAPLAVIAERKLPELLKSMAEKYGETSPEWAALFTGLGVYGTRQALRYATKKNEKKPEDEKPWGKTPEAPAPIEKPWGKPPEQPGGVTAGSTMPGCQALPD